MKLYVTSDLHLEFADLNIKNHDEVDVLILGGDICTAHHIDKQSERGERYRAFFQRVSQNFSNIIYVMGNHEHYSGDFAKSQSQLQNMFDQLKLGNIHLLEKSTVDIGEYTFIGGTLWTDLNRGDPITVHSVESLMNDYRACKNTNDKVSWKLLPRHTLEDHQAMKQYIKVVIEDRHARGITDRKVVVVTHHSPSHLSIHDVYRNDMIMNGAYHSELSEFILDRPDIALWTHGHTHFDFDYMLGDTRVVCNPRGYVGYEAQADSWQPKLVELH